MMLALLLMLKLVASTREDAMGEIESD